MVRRAARAIVMGFVRRNEREAGIFRRALRQLGQFSPRALQN